MGSGKSTLGNALSQATGIAFVDLDEAIESYCGATVSEIFASRGEAAFRLLERQELERVAGSGDVIVACGGGTPCQPGNMELMNRCGTTIWLDASMEALLRRLEEGKGKRPLIAALTPEELRAYAERSLQERFPYYSQAAHRFCSDKLESREEIDNTVAEFTRLFLP